LARLARHQVERMYKVFLQTKTAACQVASAASAGAQARHRLWVRALRPRVCISLRLIQAARPRPTISRLLAFAIFFKKAVA
ncbi:MAG TPA: hypothetical protein VEY92_04005, partial [Pseudoxanthomonas sp.]|nr:hypothetical protein [Pseudoxanthomonas sp.]